MSRNRRPRAMLLGLVLGSLLDVPAAHAGDRPDAASSECELGITLALLSRPAAAESVFTSLLSHSPRDPRALTNLGNLALLRGEADLALGFYDRARAADSTDAGILLNEATALLLLGEEEPATARAGHAVRRAGGARAAASLIGLRYREEISEVPKAEPTARVSKEELLAMLRAAAGKVPADSAGVGGAAGDTAATRGQKRAPTWRSAGARAGAMGDVAMLVYWKR